MGRRLYNLSLVVGTSAVAAVWTTCLALALAVFAPALVPALAATATRCVSVVLGVCWCGKRVLFVTVSTTVIFTVTMVLAAALPGLFFNVTCSKRGAATESKGTGS